MKLIIAGSRHITDIKAVKTALVEFLKKYPDFKVTEIVSGTCRGVDKCGEEIAKEFDIQVKQFPADWDSYGRSAGPVRNEQMAKYADGLVAVKDSESRGTKSMISLGEQYGLLINVKDI